jgi:hypothetical protein
MNGYFSDDSLTAYQEALAERKGTDFAEGDTYDFARCVRSDGSAYGTNGQCRKGREASALDVLKSGIKGRVPRNDPKEPLAGGSTPLEKAKEKLRRFEEKVSDPNKTPSEKELEQFGRLKMAVEEFENKRDGKKKGLFGGQDKSDLDESKTRAVGKEIRTLFPSVEDRQILTKAKQFHKSYLRKDDPMLARRTKASMGEILKLEERSKEVSEVRARLEAALKKAPGGVSLITIAKLENILKAIKKAESSYNKAVERLS